MNIVQIIATQEQHPQYEAVMDELRFNARATGRHLSLQVFDEMVHQLDSDRWLMLLIVLIGEYEAVYLEGVDAGRSLIVFFDVWAIFAIDQALQELGDPRYSEIDEDGLIKGVLKAAALRHIPMPPTRPNTDPPLTFGL